MASKTFISILFLLLAVGSEDHPLGAEVAVAEGNEPSIVTKLTAGDHIRRLNVADRTRSCLIHVPPQYDPTNRTPVVLMFHGAGTNGAIMVGFTGLNEKADKEGFIVVYPNGTGVGDFMLTWNAGGLKGRWAERRPDDVAFVATLLDDLATVVSLDPKRIYATGMSNGGMMCYKLAADLSERIAAIAPVAGTMTCQNPKPKRPVPIIHFHGTADTFVPFKGPNRGTPGFLSFKSVDETILAWTKVNGCPSKPTEVVLPQKEGDTTKVKRRTYGPGKNGPEVVLYVIEGGGHTWPGRTPPVGFIGKSTLGISANDLMWEFFKKHPMQ